MKPGRLPTPISRRLVLALMLLATALSGSGATTLAQVPEPCSPLGSQPAGACWPGADRQAPAGDLADTFDDPGKGILTNVSVQPAASIDYEDGEWVARIDDPGSEGDVAGEVARTARTTRDVVVAVDARIIGAVEGRSVAVACRAHGEDEYRFSIRPSDGSFTLARWEGGREIVLAVDTDSPSIKHGNETNRVQLACVGTSLTASVNGSRVASAMDEVLRDGATRIVAGQTSGSVGPLEVRFDNLIVSMR